MNITEYIKSIDREDISIHIPQDGFTDNDINTNGVLLISHELSRTGAPIQMLELAIALRDLGYQPFIYSLSEGDLISDYMKVNIPVICGDGNRARSADWIDRLVYGFDMIFINTLLLASYVRYLSNDSILVYWWIHESTYAFKEKYITEIPKSSRLNILAASEKTRDHIKKFMKRESVVLNVCIEDHEVRMRKTTNKTVFLWSGFLDYNKAPEILFQAVLCLSSDYLNRAEFIIVGQSHNKNEYADLVEAISSRLPNIKYMNALNHNDFLNLMDTVDAVIVTSIEETTSMVAVEGLMKKKTVICSDGCGVSKYFNDGQNGFIFPIRDSKKLSEMIKYVIDNDEKLETLRRAGRLLYEKYYSYDIFKSHLQEILSESHLA